MSIESKQRKGKARRAARVHKKMRDVSPGGMRISVFRSINQIYGQLIDDAAHNTLATCSSLELKALTGDKKARAHAVGVELGKRAVEKGVERAAFDRGAYIYHGRVKAFADGLREGGLQV